MDVGTPARESSAVSVFCVNQRLIFYAGTGVLLVLLWGLMSSLVHSLEAPTTLRVLTLGWLVGALLTWPIYKYSARATAAGSAQPRDPLPRICERLFQVDCLILLVMIGYGWLKDLFLYPLAYVLFANALVYCSLMGGVRRLRTLWSPIVALTLAVIVFSQRWPAHAHDANWFNAVLLQGSLVLVLSVASLSASVMSWLRSIDQAVTHKHMQLLGQFARELSPQGRTDLRDLHKRLRRVLKRLAGSNGELRYQSGSVWFFEHHKDRGVLCLLAPHFGHVFQKADLKDAQKRGLDASDPRFGDLSPIIEWHTGAEPVAPILMTATTAIVPITAADRALGFVRLEGAARRPLSLEREVDFLRSLSAIVSNATMQWRSLLDDFALTEMDDLFRCESLRELFRRAATVMRSHLNAAACMVVFRPEPTDPAMTIEATEGFPEPRYLEKVTYAVGEGQTGLCAREAIVIRYDDVGKHRREFSQPFLKSLEKALGEPVTSWMAIPIGAARNNHGVIKVINSTARGWFTGPEEKLGKALALRLHAIVEKFLHISQTEAARQSADKSLSAATEARQVAEQIAQRRQDDLMVITHQLQAPLASVVGAVTGLQRIVVRMGRHDVNDKLEHVHALIEDGLALCYGTFTTFAREAGRDATFGDDQVNALDELRKLCTRLQRTNARNDLTFEFSADAKFPLLRVDRNVFTSVFYSLIHNAMKYADSHSYVKLECSFERGSGRAAMKVKSYGEPIHPDERELIFTKYHRGKVIEQTGRHHSGVGLGLWVARELLVTAEGEITVELSTADPRLSVFVVHLPSHAEAAAAAIA